MAEGANFSVWKEPVSWRGERPIVLFGGGAAGRVGAISESGSLAFSPHNCSCEARASDPGMTRLAHPQWPDSGAVTGPINEPTSCGPTMSNTVHTRRSTFALSLSSSHYHHSSRTSLRSRTHRFTVAMAPPSIPAGIPHSMDATFVAVNPAPVPRQPAHSSTKSSGKSAEPKPPRPPNAWILYRSDKIKELPPREDGRSRTQAEVSQMVSKMWAEVSPEERADYEAKADRAKAAHMKKFPDYKYAPVKKEVREQERQKRKLEKEQERAESGPNRRRKTSPYSEPGPLSAGSRGPSPPMSCASTDSSPELVTRQLSDEAGPSHVPGPSQLPAAPAPSPSHIPPLPYPDSTPHLEMPQGSHVPAAVMMIHPGYTQQQYAQAYPSQLWQPQPQQPQQAQPSFPSLLSDLEWPLQSTTETTYVPPQNASQNASFQMPQVPAPAVETEAEAFAHDSFTALLGSTGDASVFQVQLNTDGQDFSEPPAELSLNFDLGTFQADAPFNESMTQWASYFAPQEEAEAPTGLDMNMWKKLWEAAEAGPDGGATYPNGEGAYQAEEGVFQPSTNIPQGRHGSAQSQDMMDYLNLDPPFSASSHDGSFGNSVGMSQGSSSAPQAVHSSHSSSPEPRREYHPPSGAANAGTRRVGGSWTKPAFVDESPSSSRASSYSVPAS
ncbi:hypothetical protein DENSPDRAFT_411801 [Dentipellis sp. KUC8613]|nr:hypothetical protein DENSPDRAFT_411801 [Dentipellis sp. KUC8613]